MAFDIFTDVFTDARIFLQTNLYFFRNTDGREYFFTDGSLKMGDFMERVFFYRRFGS